MSLRIGKGQLQKQASHAATKPQNLNPPKLPLKIQGKTENRSDEPVGGRVETREARR